MKERFNKPVKEWIKFAVWAIIYVLFILWVGNLWWLLLLPLILDRFITKFIAWDFWKKTKNPTMRSIFGWVDAIVFALVAVYFINLYLFQNYQIPTSSLEKSLLVGDFLCVNKASYGPRIPNTPLSFPLVQHTFPWGSKSYSDAVQWKYRRLKGWNRVKRGDIVVFNFPTGDSVPLKKNNPDYYSLIYTSGIYALSKKYPVEDILQHPDIYKDRIYSAGKQILLNDPNEFGQIVWRPVDRRENYVKRCVAVAGDTFQIINNQTFINGKIEKDFPNVQYNYYVQTDGTQLTNEFFNRLGISVEDRHTAQYLPPDDTIFSRNYAIWDLPMTKEVYEKVKKLPYIKRIVIKPTMSYDKVFPLYVNYGWDRDNFGPVVIPQKDATVTLTLSNLPVYERIISVYEHNTLEIKDSTIFINGKKSTTYTFQMDYYFMMGDNRHNSADSRYWGFVPEDHIVGRPVFVWLSLNKDKSWFGGKIRWKRFFTSASE